MPIKYNNFDIGNAYLGNDNLVAMYQGSNLVWTNGIKLKSLVRYGNSFDLSTQWSAMSRATNVVGNGEISFEMTTSGYAAQISDRYGLKELLKSSHKYFAFLRAKGKIASEKYKAQASIKLYDHQVQKTLFSQPYTDIGEQYTDIYSVVQPTDNQVSLSSSIRVYFQDETGSTSVGDTFSMSKVILIDLTQAKLDTLTAEQIYNLLTLNGTDFTDLELLANGYQVDLSKWKQQTTNTLNLKDFTWEYDSDNKVFICFSFNLPNANVSRGMSAIVPNYTNSGSKSSANMNDMTFQIISATQIWFKNLSLTNVNDFKETISTITYELSSSNNIGGSKYGFIQIKDLTLTRADSGRFFGTLKPIKSYSSSQYANIFTEKLSVGNYTDYYTKAKDKIISSLAQDIQFYDSSCEKLDDFTEKYGNDYIVYELANSLGDKLDEYTAEQVYYMFFNTLGSQKMYVPKGIEFESSDNVIIGTKYGIVDLYDLCIRNGIAYQSDHDRFIVYAYSIGIKLLTNTSAIFNAYCKDYTSTIYKNGDSKDKQVFQYVNGAYIYFTDRQFGSDIASFRNSLKGKYLIYELATPNGTNYNDLSAKQMYDLINDNAIDLLANGKSISGIRNLLGKQNVPHTVQTSQTGFHRVTNNGSWKANWIDYETDNVITTLNTSHKYCVIMELDVNSAATPTSFAYKPNAYEWASISVSNYYTDNSSFCCSIFTSTDSEVRFGMVGKNVGDVLRQQVVIDLTEHNLQNLTAQQVYQYFKENNLFKMTTTGVINIGGLKK